MKRKLALLMAFMMAATLLPAQPADAATQNVVNKVVSASSSSTLDQTTGVQLSLGEQTGSVSIKGAKEGDYFELHLSGDAVWTYDASAYRDAYYKDTENVLYPAHNNPSSVTVGTSFGLKNATVRKLSDNILGVKVNGSNINNDVDVVEVPMMVFLNGTAEGPQKVTVVPKDSSVSPGEYTYATVGESSVKLRVQKKEKISRSGNTKVQLILDEVTPSSLKSGTPIKLKLPRDFAWDIKGPTKDPFTQPANAKVKIEENSEDRILEIDPTGATGKLDSIYVNVAIIPLRDAKKGDVDVIVQGNSDVSPSSLVVAEYVDYGVQVTAEKVLSVIAGKDVEGLYKSKLIIEEPATSSLQGNRYMEFEFVDENGKAVNASLQDAEQLKLTKKSGDTNVELKIDGASISSTKKDTAKTPAYTVSTDKDTKADQFDLYVDEQSEKTRVKYELEVPFVVASNYEGKLYLKVKGAGAEEQLVQIADVKAPVTFEVKGTLPQVKIGLQKQDGQDVAVTETEAGALQDYVPEGTKNYAEYKLELEEKFATFKSVSYEKEGDIGIKEVDYEPGYVYVRVDRRSTKPSTITFKGITVTLDRTVPYGEMRLKGMFGVVKGRHDLTNNVKTFDYFTTITPVSDEKRITTVFKIGEKTYTELVKGGTPEQKTIDVAPFIQDNRTMLPVRYVADAIGAVVNYDPTTRIATFQKYQSVISINIDQKVMYVNGSPVALDTKPTNVEGRIFLPVANIAQAFGLKHGETLIWDQEAKTVTILPQDATDEEKAAAKNLK